MSMETEAGFAFERELANELGMELQPGSGNQFYARLDMRGKLLRLSAKCTKFKSYPLGVDELEEAMTAVDAPGGEVAGTIPIWGIRVAHDPRYDVIVMRKEDWIRAFTEERKFVVQSKADGKRERSSLPALLRDTDEDTTGDGRI